MNDQPTLGELVEYLVRRGQATGRLVLEINHDPLGGVDIPDEHDWVVDYRTGRGDNVDGSHWRTHGHGDSAEAAVRDVLAKRGWSA